MNVSVVTAVYDKEAVLEEYTAHTLSQKGVEFELILVDDCSPDKCPEIIDQIAEKHTNVVVIHREKNGGHVEAVNTGIMAARGEYIIAVDADDYLNYDYALRDMYEIARREDADAVFSDFTGHYINGKHLDESLVYSGRDLFVKMMKEDWYHPTHRSRLWRAPCFKNNLPINLIVDDEEWTPRAMFLADKIAIYPRKCYVRTTPDNSVTRTVSEFNYFRKSRDRIIAAESLNHFFKGIDLSNDEKKQVYKRILGLYMMAIDIRVNNINSYEYKTEIDDLINETLYIFDNSKYVGAKYIIYNDISKLISTEKVLNLYKGFKEHMVSST